MQLACDIFPDLAHSISDNELRITMEMLAPKFLIPCFIDTVPIEANLVIWDDWLGGGKSASSALVRASLALVDMFQVCTESTVMSTNMLF